MKSIGTVNSASSDVTVVRADGTIDSLKIGDPIFEGDKISTGSDDSVAIIFDDQSIFSMSGNSTMVVDAMVYNAESQSGTMVLDMPVGVATFISGFIAKTDPNAMQITTPVATIGIRGTQVGILVDETGNTEAVLMEEVDGFIGEIVVQGLTGLQVINQKNFATQVLVADPNPSEPFPVELQMILDKFGVSVDFAEEAVFVLDADIPEIDLPEREFIGPQDQLERSISPEENDIFSSPDFDSFQTDSGNDTFQEDFTQVTTKLEISNETQDIFDSFVTDIVDTDGSSTNERTVRDQTDDRLPTGLSGSGVAETTDVPESDSREADNSANDDSTESDSSGNDSEIGTDEETYPGPDDEIVLISTSSEVKTQSNSETTVRFEPRISFEEEVSNGVTTVNQVTQTVQITIVTTTTVEFVETTSIWSDGTETKTTTEPTVVGIDESHDSIEYGEPTTEWFSRTSEEFVTTTTETWSDPIATETTEYFDVIITDPSTGDEYIQVSKVITTETHFEVTKTTATVSISTTVYSDGRDPEVVTGEPVIAIETRETDPTVIVGDPEIITYDPIEDDNHGHGNDHDGHDDDNPGQGNGNRDDDHDRGHGNDHDGHDDDNPGQGNGNRDDDHDRGHGNDHDGHDDDNLGQGNGNRDDDHDRGHGNDHDGHDDDNLGQGRGHSWSVDDFGIRCDKEVNFDYILGKERGNGKSTGKNSHEIGNSSGNHHDHHNDHRDDGYSVTNHDQHLVVNDQSF